MKFSAETETMQETFVCPLSPAQKRLWILAQFPGANEAYNIMGVLDIKGAFSLDTFNQCIQILADRHESLRTTFAKDDEDIYQVIHPRVDCFIPLIRMNKGDGYTHEDLQRAIRTELSTPFNLEKGPLFRIRLLQVADHQHLLLFCMHHIISDGWSLHIFISELSHLYNAFRLHQQPALPVQNIQYADYAIWQENLEKEGVLQHQLTYWRNQLRDAPALLELPLGKPRPQVQSFAGAIIRQSCNKELAKSIYNQAHRLYTTPFVLLLSAFHILLSRYSGQADIVTGTPVANRNRKELEHVIGFFVNTLPIRLRIGPSDTFDTVVEQARQTVWEALDKQQVSFEKIIESVPLQRSSAYNPLFQVMFSLNSFGSNAVHLDGLETQWVPVEGVFSKFDLTLAIQEEEVFTESWEYNAMLFEETVIRNMALHFHYLLEQLMAHPAVPIQNLRLLNEEEEQRIVYQWNQTHTAFPLHQCFHHFFEQHAIRAADKIAVIAEDGRLSYHDLNQQANRLAHYLVQQGVEPGTHVGLCLDRTTGLMVALLAIMKAGGVYVPVDPAYPAERQVYIFSDAGISHLITHRGLVSPSSATPTMQVLEIEAIWENLVNMPAHNITLQQPEPASPVYIIYTSGSTGMPKGVRIPHKALLNFLFSMADRPGIEDSDRLLAVTSLSFDIAGLELYLPLLNGATTVIASRKWTQDGQLLANCLRDFDITMMQATPATWRLLLEAGWPGKPDLKALCGGEAFPRQLATWLHPKTASLWNMYGPTETTIWSSVFEVEQSDRAIVPIGKPIANTCLYVLDKGMHAVPPGVAGDLYIGGSGLAIDYHRRQELTAAKFITHPYQAEEKVYCTGDKARYLLDGNIEFLGRGDFQVKVNGYRIELEEVEYHLSRLKGVKQAVAAVKTPEDGITHLVAYLVTDNEPVVPEAFRNELLRKLPAYVVPSFFIRMDALPLTLNGKVDRQALPLLDDSSYDAIQTPYAAPETAAEKVLAEIWQEVLQVNRIGLHDNFFNLGGASLQSIRVASKATKAGLSVTPQMIFEFQTVQTLAEKASAMADTDVDVPDFRQEDAPLSRDLLYDGSAGKNNTLPHKKKIIIESLACYLPEKVVTSKEIVDRCTHPVRFPMERLTGIQTRREAGENEFAFDMALRAMETCFGQSACTPNDIDILIACNVFRLDSMHCLTLEPSTAARLAQRMGCDRAVSFDVSNACAGIFTAITLAESFIQTGAAGRVMLVTGEYLTHLTRTAQHEVKDYMDLSISALTVGDSAMAMILERSEYAAAGFLDIDMFTMGGYSDLCVVKAAGKEQGGLLLKTDAIRMAEAGHHEASKHALKTLSRHKWGPAEVDFLIMHQASSTTTANVMREVNRFLGTSFANPENTIDNIRHRGNTATTTHWMAIQDNILSGKIKNNQRIVLFISGSGLNIGTALYQFDDLPERIMQFSTKGIAATKKNAVPAFREALPAGRGFRVRVLAASAIRKSATDTEPTSALSLLTESASACLQKTGSYDKNDLGVVIYTGIHRDEHIYEPAISSILAGKLDINAYVEKLDDSRRTLCFDLFNSNIAFLQACYTAAEMMRSQKISSALVATAEMENNAVVVDAPQLGVTEGGAAMFLQQAPDSAGGFGNFLFRHYPGLDHDWKTWVCWKGATTVVRQEKKTGYQYSLVRPVGNMVTELLKMEQLTPEDIDYIVPPFLDETFLELLSGTLQMPQAAMVTVEAAGEEMQSLTFPFLFHRLLSDETIRPGTKALLISAGAGGQAGCSIYYF